MRVYVCIMLCALLSMRHEVSGQDEPDPTMYTPTTMEPVMNDFTGRQFAVIVKGVQLSELSGRELARIMKKEIFNQRVLIFKNQDIIDSEELAEIALLFGKKLEDSYDNNVKSDRKEVHITSNKGALGDTLEDGLLWHVGGFSLQHPHSIGLIQVKKLPKKSPIVLIPLDEVVDSLAPEKLKEWERITIRSGHNPDVLHPLVHHHPVTDLQTLCFDIEGMYSIIFDHGTDLERIGTAKELEEFQTDLMNVLSDDNKHWHYSHKWEEGDVVLFDSISVAQLYMPLHMRDATEYVLKHVYVHGQHVPALRPGTPRPDSSRLSDEPGEDIDDGEFEPDTTYQFKAEL